MLGNISHCLDYRDRKVTVDLVGKSEGGRVFIYYYAQDNFLNQKKKDYLDQNRKSLEAVKP